MCRSLAQKSCDFQRFFVLASAFEQHKDKGSCLMLLKMEMDVPELELPSVSVMPFVLCLELCMGQDEQPLVFLP